jgi:hypothetical protein
MSKARLSVREQLIANEMACCRFYNGTGIHDVCGAGITYRALAATSEPGWVRRLPCHSIFFADDIPRVACEKESRPTREEAERAADDTERRFAEVATAMAACRADGEAHGFKKGRGGRAAIACPICSDGLLRYSISGYNGHLHGHCSTEGCVSWMQ